MRIRSRFTLDTNILIYAVDRDAGEKHDKARDLIGQAALRDCVLTVQALAEFFHATTRKKLVEPGRASEFVRDWLDVFAVASAGHDSLIEAMDATREHSLSFWDAMLWATARQCGCSVIVSEDMQHGRRLGGVEIADPFRPEMADSLRTILEA